ncbi:MAG: transcriptional repressor [Candidatus Adiutrix sp.]|jgi:Fur family ferric uptake transcriptional regulator|nr:transcriptional repressor [Candidatus Adiutrix sp.]
MAEKASVFPFQKASKNDPDLQREMDSFRSFLRSKTHRVTRERESIAEAVLLNRGHFDVDELFLALKGRVGVSKASIYRTIPILIEAGILAAVYLEDGHMHYERVFGRDHHSHLRCTSCGRIFEFSVPELPVLEKRIAEQQDFKSEGHKFEIWGLCAKCLRSDR